MNGQELCFEGKGGPGGLTAVVGDLSTLVPDARYIVFQHGSDCPMGCPLGTPGPEMRRNGPLSPE